jgi:hypothetical protein
MAAAAIAGAGTAAVSQRLRRAIPPVTAACSRLNRNRHDCLVVDAARVLRA